MRVNVHVRSLRSWVVSTYAYRRATVWLDENDDWLWMPIVFGLLIWATAALLGYVPHFQWTR